MTKEFEITREIFNKCSGNQMRDVFLEERELDSDKLDEFVRGYFSGDSIEIERLDESEAVVVFNIELSGQLQRLTFCVI